MHIFITGIAGFIGANAAEQLLKAGHRVTGIDNLNDYYDVSLKYARLNELGISKETSEEFLNVVTSTNKNYDFKISQNRKCKG